MIETNEKCCNSKKFTSMGTNTTSDPVQKFWG